MFDWLKAPLREFGAYRALRWAWHFTTDPVFRRDHVMLVRRPGNLFQYRSVTFANRYPGIFQFIARQLATTPEPSLLSFGCATGEEVIALRQYLPAARIKGVDINPTNIARCREKLLAQPDPRITFALQDSAAGEPPAAYDAIFCLAIFQHFSLRHPKYRTCDRFIRFEAFEQTIAGLSRCLKPGGFLALRHANFHFRDTLCSRDFVPVMLMSMQEAPHPRFDRHNRRLPSEADSEIVFQKQTPQALGRTT